ncbi:hypothetical protein J1N35_003083 [Gossypium stocksii]|uniref:Uncharacterized protein n=1 Tax=Gossypium stocksii TaxID=47602 RepID=A0A9D3WND9_9ROSI|nr:hypothetical protein J1N35_003083 [Gossypium stocksii]
MESEYIMEKANATVKDLLKEVSISFPASRKWVNKKRKATLSELSTGGEQHREGATSSAKDLTTEAKDEAKLSRKRIRKLHLKPTKKPSIFEVQIKRLHEEVQALKGQLGEKDKLVEEKNNKLKNFRAELSKEKESRASDKASLTLAQVKLLDSFRDQLLFAL